MKPFITLLLFVCSCFGAFAQSLKLNIISKEKEPLAYAYVFINHNFFSSADSCGKVEIPTSLLNIGDTITASYTGAKDNIYIYDNEKSLNKEQTIELTQSILLSELIVKPTRITNKLFNRYVKKPEIGNYLDEFHGDMTIIISNSNLFNKIIQGTFKYTLFPYEYRVKNKIEEYDIYTKCDTSGVSTIIKRCLGMVIEGQSGVILNKRHYATKGMIAQYIGEDDHRRVFMITRPSFYNLNKNLDSFQTLIYVDKKSKRVVSSEVLSIYGNGFMRYDIKISYAFNKKQNVIYPTKIQGTLSIRPGKGKLLCEVLLNNINHNRKDKKSIAEP